MHELGVESSLLAEILDGNKTIEVRLGKPPYLKMRVGDTLQLREDIWKGGRIVQSLPHQGVIVIEQKLYFESFEELLSSIDIREVIPSAKTQSDAMAVLRTFYTQEDEEEFGVIAIMFRLA